MENLSHSRHPNRSKKSCGNAAAAAPKSLYDDVYGGPPKFSAMAARTTNHLSPRMEDYSEIFGSFQASRTSSIPVLDLPAVDESEVFFDARRSSGFDYAEIFGGGSQGFDFAVSYEDLVNGNSSDEAWSGESDISGKNYSNGGSHHRLNGDTEFSVTYHQARKMSSEDVTNNGVTHVAQLHSVPGYSFMVDSPSRLSEDRVAADDYLDMDFGTETKKSKQLKKAKSSSSNGGIGGNGREGSSHRNSFLDISDINLRTHPSDLPPPSRPPPAVGGKKADSDQPVSKSDSLDFEGIAGDSSPNFFDVEVDASSSAAVSAAAIKEAVEKAQARLKSAKELMEKKKGLRRSHNSGSKKFTNDETVKGGASERDGVETELVGKEEKREASNSAFEVPEVFHGEALLSSQEKHDEEEKEEDKHEKESLSSSGSYKIDESNDWKEATEFFEVVTTDELKKDFEHCEKIMLQNLQNNGHEHEANGAAEISQKQSEKVKAEDHEAEEFEEKKKVEEVPKHKEEQSVNVEEEKTDGATRTKQLLEPNERIAEADNRRTENTEPTLIACNNDESSEEIVPPQETLACEKVETASSEMDSGVAGRQNEFIDKNFTEPSITGDDFTDESQDTLPSDCSEINVIPEVTEELGVFEIENLLVGEKLKAFGQLPENSGATELSHLDNQVKKTEEIGSITGEPSSEQVTSSSPKLPKSEKQESDLTHECTRPQVSVNKESAMPTQAVKESSESERKMEEKQKNQKPVQKVNASHSTDIKEKTHEEVDTERGKREKEREKEKPRLRKADEEKEREKEREVQQKNQKSAPTVETERKQSKTTERKEKTPREVESERTENERLRRIEEEREREREREKDRMAVDLATLERESRERAERVAVERATAEARQRAMADARERLEKACAEAREKSLAGKTAESRVRAERAAVERATAEARERAAGRAMAVQKSVSDKFSASSVNSRLRQSASSSDLQSQSSGVSRFQNSAVYSERYEGVEGESAQRCKARLERHRRTTERAAKALAEKNMRDLLAQREQTERSRVAETLDADVRRWSSGKEGNLRALLSTLQYILGPESGWQPIPLTEVITSAAVKKAYRKATLCVHPDKLQQRGANIQQKYLCEKVFDLLKEGWNKFNSEER